MKNNATNLVDTPSPESISRALNAQRTTPTIAMLFHTRDNGQKLSVVTAHAIRQDRKRRFSIEPGRPLTPEDELHILHLLRPCAAADTFTVYPSELLHTTGSYTMWWLAPTLYPMTLAGNDATVVRDVIWPNLVLLAMQRRLYVVAVAGDARPTADSDCFYAPCANIWANTEVCVGSSVLPEGQGIADIPGWNRVLRDTAFTHANARDIIRDTSKKGRQNVDPMDYWRKAKPTPFPDASLVSLKFKLRDWIDYTAAVERR